MIVLTVGSQNRYEYIRRLAHTPPYATPKSTHVSRYEVNAVKELFRFDYKGELIKEDRIMVEALIFDVVKAIRQCYWHQKSFIPF